MIDNKFFDDKKNKSRLTKIYKIITVFLISIIVSNIYIYIITLNKEKIEDKVYSIVAQNTNNVNVYGIVSSNIKESDYKYSFEIEIDYIVLNNNKIISFKNKNVKIISYINKNETINIFPGDYIRVIGKIDNISSYNNFKIFNYEEYLKRKNIYGSIDIEKSIDIILIKNKYDKFKYYRYKIIEFVIKRVTKNIDTNPGILIGILIGNTDLIEEEVVENFNKSSISHILAVSGTHVSFIIIFIGAIFDKIINNYRLKKIMLIIILIMFLYIIGFTASVARAVIMGIVLLLSKLIFRKSDVLNNLLFSAIVLLVINPYFIFDLGFLLSYLTTMGIIMFYSNIEKLISKTKGKNFKYKVKEYIKTSIIISISSNLMIIPVMSYSMNNISLTYIIPNLLIGPLVILLEILGIIYLIIPNFFILNYFISFILDLVDKIAFNSSKIPFSSILTSSPSIIEIIIFYIIIYLFYMLLTQNSKNQLINKLKKIKIQVSNILKRFNNNENKDKNLNMNKKILIRKVLILITILLIIFISYFKINIFKKGKIEICFLDVGQGDCTFINTENNKKILIDGGGNEYYDIGENILKPYFLKRKIKKLDYIIISHLDFDHVGGIISLLDYIKVEKIILPIQFEKYDNLDLLLEKIKKSDTEIILLKAKDKIYLDENTYIDVLWPDKQRKVLENSINNNALVFKLNYKKFSMLFTGDIENEAESALVEKYKNNKKILKSTVLKVAHHGAETSSIQNILDLVSPKISLIGVGRNNNYGHPSKSVIDRLNKLNSRVYRTDRDGEIIIKVNKYGDIEDIEKYK